MRKRRLSFSLHFSAFSGALLAACGATPPREINEKYKSVLEQRAEQYAIKDGDVIDIDYWNEAAADLEQAGRNVLPDGRSDLFFLDNHSVLGKSVPALEAEIKEAVKGQFQSPEVSIRVTPRLEEVVLTGEFERPGAIRLDRKMTLNDAIARAGGIRITAAPWAATLRRPYHDPAHPDVFTIDLLDDSEEIYLLPGDHIDLDRNVAALIVRIINEYIFGIIPAPFYSGALFAAGI
jgi:protein involved in polysaccharide export with SLBB domain